MTYENFQDLESEEKVQGVRNGLPPPQSLLQRPRSGMPWAEAEKHCQLENAHLVVINSREEQNFVQEHLSFAYTWMGLSDREGAWKWVDGTDYETGFQNWKPGQPDDWQGHGLGGGEDCAHFHPDGRWNDDVCQRPYYWVCEAGLTQASQESH